MLVIRLAYVILNLPYSALRAFEAVVRQSGFSAAADELGVSQSAVSQHVKALEEWLGQDLLVRGARASVPTPDGARLARAIAEGLGRISDVCADLRDRGRTDKTLVISCLPGFAFIWLFPRLMRFDLAHPDMAISIVTDNGRKPSGGAEADVGIRYGLGDYPGLEVERLMGERLFPVCAPALVSGQPPLRALGDLALHTRLEDETLDFGAASPTWDFWARTCGVTLPPARRTRRFGQTNMVVQAAIEGVGVALGREPLVIDALHDGRLVRPLDGIAPSPLSYWLVCGPEMRRSGKVAVFLDWLRAEVAAQPDLAGVGHGGD
ncbi:transcriptional regulator, LysR family [Cribrihabitans marinus]|uniref:Transcriptional regulator, LysR family n=1 Tax=Cribrihabitans marinus TaxID=1227549 RepID=A0A1H6ZD99_9RHOB|nr:LysR substrate-binding domain-containing protein [Cribrihabitans marinus]GGH31178.1 LysR family transcriptional regulator [Cribrihabitans marinus]SEJ49417.1 transcriptional regulator, LysR family [Cribrihabitans marinus]